MSTPSPGPGWWLASDGKWYPQRWEYKSATVWNYSSVEEATEAVQKFANDLGQEGWEMVSSNVYCKESKAESHPSGGANIYNLNLQNGLWGMVCLLKRPIAP
jgi:hypothetical protein